MFSRVGGGWHLRKVALVLLAGCLVSFAAGQVAGHYALPAPPLASLAARADAPDAAAIAGAISKAQRPTVRQPGTHKPTSKPTSRGKPRSQPKAKKAHKPHAMHDPKIHHRHGKQSDSGGNDNADQPSAGQSAAEVAPLSGSTGGGDQTSASGPERLPPESTGA